MVAKKEQVPMAGMPNKANAPAGFAALPVSGVALLTTFRRNGQGVSTPVGIRVVGSKVYFTTWSTTWKIKRIAHTPRVTLAASTRQGKVIGPAVAGLARRLDGAEAEQASRLLGHAFLRWVWELVYKVVFRAQPVYYEVTPLPEDPDSC
jgi:PPOX class probable F420-dependent enzyme